MLKGGLGQGKELEGTGPREPGEAPGPRPGVRGAELPLGTAAGGGCAVPPSPGVCKIAAALLIPGVLTESRDVPFFASCFLSLWDSRGVSAQGFFFNIFAAS